MTMSRFRLAGFAGLLVVTALVGGTIIGSVAAATAPQPTPPDPIAGAPSAIPGAAGSRAAGYCARFKRVFAANLGVAESALTPAAKAAAISTIDGAVTAGEMTKAAGDRRKARIETVGADGCALLAGRIGAARAGTRGAAGALGVIRDGFGAAASALGMTPADLRADLRGGQTLKDLATARGIPYENVSAAIVASVKSDLDAAVAAGKVKQVRVDLILKRLQANLADGRLRDDRPATPAGSAAPGTGG